MGSEVIMNMRARLMGAINDKVDRKSGLDKKFDFLRDVVYELVEAIYDDEELERLVKQYGGDPEAPI